MQIVKALLQTEFLVPTPLFFHMSPPSLAYRHQRQAQVVLGDHPRFSPGRTFHLLVPFILK